MKNCKSIIGHLLSIDIEFAQSGQERETGRGEKRREDRTGYAIEGPRLPGLRASLLAPRPRAAAHVAALDTMQFDTILRVWVPRVDLCDRRPQNYRRAAGRAGGRFSRLFERLAIDVVLSARSAKQVAGLLGQSSDEVDHILRRPLERGLSLRELDALTGLGMEEKTFRSARSYISLMTDRPEWLARDGHAEGAKPSRRPADQSDTNVQESFEHPVDQIQRVRLQQLRQLPRSHPVLLLTTQPLPYSEFGRMPLVESGAFKY